MVDLVTCKNEENTIKNKVPRVVTRLIIKFSNVQGQPTQYSVMDLNEIQTHTIFMVFLVTCKNEEDSSKNEGIEWSHDFFHY